MVDPQRCLCGTRTPRRCGGYKAYVDGYCRACGHSRACCLGGQRERKGKKGKASA